MKQLLALIFLLSFADAFADDKRFAEKMNCTADINRVEKAIKPASDNFDEPELEYRKGDLYIKIRLFLSKKNETSMKATISLGDDVLLEAPWVTLVEYAGFETLLGRYKVGDKFIRLGCKANL
jgi:hypothetical protein